MYAVPHSFVIPDTPDNQVSLVGVQLAHVVPKLLQGIVFLSLLRPGLYQPHLAVCQSLVLVHKQALALSSLGVSKLGRQTQALRIRSWQGCHADMLQFGVASAGRRWRQCAPPLQAKWHTLALSEQNKLVANRHYMSLHCLRSTGLRSSLLSSRVHPEMRYLLCSELLED